MLHGDLQRWEAMICQRGGEIAELRDEAYTYGPSSGSLSDAEFPRLFRVWTSIFKFLMKKRWKNPFPRMKQTLRCFDAPSSVPFLREAEVPAEAGSSSSPVGALPSNLHGSEARTTEATRSTPSNT